MTKVVPGKSNGKKIYRGPDYGYVWRHGICAECGRDVYKVKIGNSAGWRYSEPMIKTAVEKHLCQPVQ